MLTVPGGKRVTGYQECLMKFAGTCTLCVFKVCSYSLYQKSD